MQTASKLVLPVGKPLVALLVEDQPADAELIAIRLATEAGPLSGEPISIIQAGSASEACEVLKASTVDVVILDLTLPDARWLEGLHRVRATAPGVPIIVLTGTADEAVGLEALRAGAQDYVLKPPPDAATLRRILRHARERQHLMQERDVAVKAAELAARRWWLLSEVGRLLAGSVISGAALAEVIALVVPDAAAQLVVIFAGEDDALHLVEVGDANVKGMEALRQRANDLLDVLVSDERTFLRALDGERPDDAEARAQQLQQMGMVLEMFNACVVPLRIGGRATGVLAMTPAPARLNAPDDVEFARTLADRISIALERAQLFEQTQRAIVARDRAFGIVSHDLRNPLGTIQICATALLDPQPPPPHGIRQMADMIQRSAAWMQRIVTDLLDRASLDAGRLALVREATSVFDIAREVRAMFTPVAAEAGVTLEVECAQDLPRVDADPNRLLQILANLINNAIKFTATGGHIDFSARRAEENEVCDPRLGAGQPAVRFAVRDNGPGIAEADLPYIFDWYWRSRRRTGSGAGLGLGIARGLVEAHRSQLHVESRLGEGSTFWFTIPAVLE